MKNKIKAALQQGQYKNLGLDEKAFEGVAAYLATSITDEAEIETKVNSDEVKALLKSFQSVADAARANARAKNEPNPQPTEPGKPNPEPKPQDPPKPAEPQPQDLAKTIAAAVAEAIKPISDELATFKGEQSAKAALSAAENTFKSNDYVKKYADEATDAWERATEMYEATGKKWTADELNEKAMGYFNKAVGKKGVDTTKPFKSDGGAGGDNTPDFSSFDRAAKDLGWTEPETK